LEALIQAPDFWNGSQKAKELTKEAADLRQARAGFEALEKQFQDSVVHWDLATEAADSKELAEAQGALAAVSARVREWELKLKLSGPHDRANALFTIHAGAGGTEACDWAEMLLRMYRMWAAKKGLGFTVTNILPGEEAGVKNASVLVEGECAYGMLKGETGVHRLVRVSPFDSNKRRHTSFASCDVLPDIEEEIAIEVPEADLALDTFRAGAMGDKTSTKWKPRCASRTSLPG